jgi:hypothetical protein
MSAMSDIRKLLSKSGAKIVGENTKHDKYEFPNGSFLIVPKGSKVSPHTERMIKSQIMRLSKNKSVSKSR